MKILIHTIALNRADLLKQMIESIDTKLDYEIFIHLVSKDSELLDYLGMSTSIDDAVRYKGPFLGSLKQSGYSDDHILLQREFVRDHTKITVKNIQYNIGVAQCWNDALEYGYESKKYDRILFVNSDIKFGPGDIDKMISFSEAKPDKLITVCGTHGKHRDKWDGMDLSHGFACAILPPSIFSELGYFDENFFPAYNEDCDYFTRLWKSRNISNIKPGYDKISAKDSPLVECIRSGRTHHEGSSVIYSDSKLMQLNRESHGQNNRYYLAKWGGSNDHESYNRPFDLDEIGYKIELKDRHNPYSEYWDRTKEKEAYYAKIL